MTKLTPFLLFDGTCAEAMGFYHSVLGGQLSVIELGDTPMKEQAPAHQHHRVVFANLQSDALELSATDWLHPTRVPRVGNTVGLYMSDATYEGLRVLFDQLAVGADPDLIDDLHDEPFGSYGHLADRYGVHWFFRGERSS